MRRLVLSLLAGVLGLLLVLPPIASAAGRTHTVQYGETLTSIAAEYGVSVDALSSANGLGSPNLIFVGQTLNIPDGSGPSTPAQQGGTYVVQPGDSLSGIAAQYGITTAALAQANGLTDTNFIWSGQRLTIPGAGSPAPSAPSAPAAPSVPSAPASGNQYTVQRGDNLSSIAAQFGVSTAALAQANGLTDPNLLFAGNVLTIPGKSAPAAPTQAPSAPTPTAAPAGPQATPTLEVAPTPPPDKGKVVPSAGDIVHYVVQSGDRLYSIAAQYSTTVDAIVARNHLGNSNLIIPGQTLDIMVGDTVSKPASNGQPTPTPAPITQPVTKPGKDQSPPPINSGHTGKWIDVNLSTETLTAYEGNTPVFTSLVSTGVAAHPTVVGTYKIYVKYLADDMTGGTGSEYYYLPNVPYTMYFYGGYAIHGTYWHHNFGHPMSHGCVNLPTPAAEWVYNWAPVGTDVVTHW